MSIDPHDLAGVELAVLLRDNFRAIMEYVRRGLAEAGFADIRPAHMTIFQHLEPKGSRIGELAERAGLTNQSVGYLVDYLEEHGYVERRVDPSNRRASLVCLTDKGWAEMACCARILEELRGKLVQRRGADSVEQLRENLNELSAVLADLLQTK